MQNLLLVFEGNITAVDICKYISPRFSIREESSTFITASHSYEFIEVSDLENPEEALLEWFDEDSLYIHDAGHSFIELMYSEKILATELIKSIAEKEKLIGIQLEVLFIRTNQFLRLDTEYINSILS